jgi:hypothetical protein
MEKVQIYLRKEELDALRKAAARTGRSVAEILRDAIRKVVLKPQATGPVAIWDGEPKRTSIEHDSMHDEPYAAGKGRFRRQRGVDCLAHASSGKRPNNSMSEILLSRAATYDKI